MRSPDSAQTHSGKGAVSKFGATGKILGRFLYRQRKWLTRNDIHGLLQSSIRPRLAVGREILYLWRPAVRW